MEKTRQCTFIIQTAASDSNTDGILNLIIQELNGSFRNAFPQSFSNSGSKLNFRGKDNNKFITTKAPHKMLLRHQGLRCADKIPKYNITARMAECVIDAFKVVQVYYHCGHIRIAFGFLL